MPALPVRSDIRTKPVCYRVAGQIGWACLVSVFVWTAVGCTNTSSPPSSAPTTSPATSPTATSQPSPNARRVALVLSQQATKAPLDITYRARGVRQGAVGGQVRVRLAGERFRVDIISGNQRSSLLTTHQGLVSCQTSTGKRDCYLVSKSSRPPKLFDPGVQRIFLRTLPRIAAGTPSTTIRRTGNIITRFGPAQCFVFRGDRVDSGNYCLLESGRFVGVPVRVTYRSGSLTAVSIDRLLGDNVFRPPASPLSLIKN